jgi:hypothetical protein
MDMDALQLAIVLTTVVVCVLAATQPDPNRRRSRGRQNRPRSKRDLNGGKQHRFLDVRGLTVQRNHWDRADLELAFGRDPDELDALLTVWPGV